MRKRIWQLHSWLGLVAGLGLIVIGLTGSLLVFHDEIEKLLNPGIVRVEPTAAGRLPANQLLASAQAQLPDHRIAGWLYRLDEPTQADLLYVREPGSPKWLIATVNPYSGEVLASPRLGTATFTGWVLDLHYQLLADHAGAFTAGILGLLLVLLGVSGVYLYRDFWKHLFTLRWGRGARILFSDTHRFVGITTVVFNLILGFTGAYWNLTHIVGHWIEGHDDEQPASAARHYAEPLDLDALIADTGKRIPGYLPRFVSLPTEAGWPITFYGQAPGHFLTGPYGSTVSYDAQTHAFADAHDIREAGLWARVADTFTPLHYGSFGGLPVKILWSLGGLTPGVLAVTGFLIWRHRRRRAVARTTAPVGTVPVFP
ncbi:MAG: PepSY-associated TM helix domain-containing protein [Verrucomicrobiota bacterium]